MPNSIPQIEVTNLSLQIDNKPILQDISFCINKGEYIGLIGPNGGGKTTLIKIILGLLKPTSGKIQFNSTTLQSIGYVPQRASQTLADFPATVKEIIQSGNTTNYQEILKTTHTEHLQNRLISQLSGGELQKVLIARALASKPEILILDEPIVGVDSPGQEKFYNFLKQLNQSMQITILFISHDLEVITKQATKILCLNKKMICHHATHDLTQDQHIQAIFGKDMHLLQHHHH